jgi:tripartite-type tricarboxylate transporter receptor subunit TctC
MNRRSLLTTAILAPALLQAPNAMAAYPERPIRIVIGATPGGGGETMSHLIGDALSHLLDTPVIIDHKPGAAGTIAAELVAKSEPDGHTLLWTPTSLVINPSLYRLNFDPAQDLRGIARIAEIQSVLEVRQDLPVQNFAEYIRHAKLVPKGVTLAGLPGTELYILGTIMAKQYGIDLLQIPYKGNATALNDLVAGHVDSMFDTFSGSRGQIEGGKTRPIAVASSRQIAALPGVPTLSELGMHGADRTSWYGIVAPRKTPDAVVRGLSESIGKVMADPDLLQRIAGQGMMPAYVGPAELDLIIRNSIPLYRKIVEDNGIKIDAN